MIHLNYAMLQDINNKHDRCVREKISLYFVFLIICWQLGSGLFQIILSDFDMTQMTHSSRVGFEDKTIQRFNEKMF
jgi:hypothetical protein